VKRQVGFGKSRRRYSSAVLACVAGALAVIAVLYALASSAPSGPTTSGAASGVAAPAATASASALPNLGGSERKVIAVLEAIDRTGQAPAGYRGGTQFMNDGRDAGQVLPRKDAQGKSISYREWDVNPYTGANRGTERLVTGSDGSAWYTNDHYNTFLRIR
jgi:guanyl-specific ribonuclease Sa